MKYPNFGLARRLELVAQMIKAGFGTRIFYTSLDGFDTHANQLGTHAALLTELSDSIAAFHDDLSAAGQADRVAVLTFSEFGRRVAENASLGTDHGAAAPVFLVGPVAKPGLVGAPPEVRRPRRRRPEVSHRLPPGLRLSPVRLARLPVRAHPRRRASPAAAPTQGLTLEGRRDLTTFEWREDLTTKNTKCTKRKSHGYAAAYRCMSILSCFSCFSWLNSSCILLVIPAWIPCLLLSLPGFGLVKICAASMAIAMAG